MSANRNQSGDGLALFLFFGGLTVAAIVVIQILLAVRDAQ